MPLSDELYRETILDHYHHPRHQGVIADPMVEVEGQNPLCGDELVLYLNVKDGSIADLKIKSRGCSINTASGSMMTEVMQGVNLAQAQELAQKFKDMMLKQDENVDLPEEMEDLEALRGVKKYPVRIKCALLPWNTLLEGLQCAQQHANETGSHKGKVVTTE